MCFYLLPVTLLPVARLARPSGLPAHFPLPWPVAYSLRPPAPAPPFLLPAVVADGLPCLSWPVTVTILRLLYIARTATQGLWNFGRATIFRVTRPILPRPSPSLSTVMAMLNATNSLVYWNSLAFEAVLDSPQEHVTYPVFVEFILKHKNFPERFIIYPQPVLKWKQNIKKDRRAEIPDIAIGNFNVPGTMPRFKLRLGAELKRSTPAMRTMPAAQSLLMDEETVNEFYYVFLQAMNQAKAAIKNQWSILPGSVHWLLAVGPYWRPVVFGPFTEDELEVRALKPTGSADWLASINEQDKAEKLKLKTKIPELFLLGDEASFTRLEQLIASTDTTANALTAARIAA